MPGLVLAWFQAFFGVWEWPSVTSVISRSNCPAKLQIVRSILLKRGRSLAGLVPGNLMLSMDQRDRTPSQQVRRVRLYESKRGNSISIPQTCSIWVSWTCSGEWEPHGHKSREIQPLSLVQQHNTMTHHYLPGCSWCGVGVVGWL